MTRSLVHLWVLSLLILRPANFVWRLRYVANSQALREEYPGSSLERMLTLPFYLPVHEVVLCYILFDYRLEERRAALKVEERLEWNQPLSLVPQLTRNTRKRKRNTKLKTSEKKGNWARVAVTTTHHWCSTPVSLRI